MEDGNRYPTDPYEIGNGVWMIPCRINESKHKFYPLFKPVSNNVHYIRYPWTEIEDQALISLLPTKCSKKWAQIAKELNDRFYANNRIRNGKQCRERWYNHLDPSLKKGGWTPEEDNFIIIRQQEIGNKWSLIAKDLPGRNENSVKNRWKSISKKTKTCDKEIGIDEVSDILVDSQGDWNREVNDAELVEEIVLERIDSSSDCENYLNIEDEMIIDY
ncbi:unnamed protein product [Blepharisma stoltei]|uniref:Myb-like DNA-binding domain containing protein n=1 Tax=Blepharisma stoltei TaxID=1481888 RepID=A0AAU9J7X4_9CILI|nr:unnamed protein product [Blepharisma stoltei]